MNLIEGFKCRFPAYRFENGCVKIKVVASHNGLFVSYFELGGVRVIFPKKGAIVDRLYVAVGTHVKSVEIFVTAIYSCRVDDQLVVCSRRAASFSITREHLRSIMSEFSKIAEYYQREWRKHVLRVIEVDKVLQPSLWMDK